MQQIKVQTPAKINLTLEVLNRRDDGFHNIQSIMQTISLSDFLTIKVSQSARIENEIFLSGTSLEIPYDEKNIVFKATKLYLDFAQITNAKIDIFIEKNIPVCAGLAGGSTNASGALYGLNQIFQKLSHFELHKLASTLGSDLNFCLDGGCAFCSGRGEKIEKLNFIPFNVSLIKPKKLGISAKEAYQKFALLKDKTIPNNTQKLKTLLDKNKFDKSLIYNNLEIAVFDDYKSLQEIKSKIPNSIMSGSGPTYFVIDDVINESLFDLTEYQIFNNLTSVDFGVRVLK